MARLFVTLLCLLAAGANGGNAQYVPFCDPSDYASSPSRPFPELPEQFSAVVEANIGQFNETIVVKEYYDDLGNRGRMDFAFNDTDRTGIFDYDDQEIFRIPDPISGSPCAVLPIAEPDEFINRTFGFRYDNGSVHIGSVQGLFSVHSDRPMNYTGLGEARGIPAHTWQTCFAEENNSYITTYYFATDDWAYAHDVNSLPIQITLQGRRVDFEGGLDELDHVYSFVDFNDKVSDEDFQVPIGLPCSGRIPGPPAPGPDLPDFFSTYIEDEDFDNQRSTLFKEYYDYTHNLFRFDLYFNGNQGGTGGQYALIQNFDIEVGYFINTLFSNCSVFPMTSNQSDFFAAEIGEDGNLQLRAIQDLFFLSNDYNYSYEGVTTARGVEVDVWIALRDQIDLGGANLSNAIVEWFFTRPGWEVTTDVTTTTDPTPWRLKLSGILSYVNESTDTVVTRDFSEEYDFIGFSTTEPSYDVFDTSICVSPGDYHVLSMVIPGRESGVVELGQFRRNVRTAITEYADINPVQVGRVQIVGENGTHIFVTVHLSSLPDFAMTTTPPKTSSEILHLILNNTEDDQLPFKISVGPGEPVYPTLLHVGEVSDCNDETPTSCESEDDDISRGAAVGIIIGLLAFGFVAGVVSTLVVALIVRFCVRRRPVIASVRYEKHEDDS